MVKFNSKVPWTKEVRDSVLETIKIRRKQPLTRISDCNCCQEYKCHCDVCPIGDNDGWCANYDETKTYLNKMERAAKRRKVVDG